MTGVKFDVWLSYVTQALASKSVGHPTILSIENFIRVETQVSN